MSAGTEPAAGVPLAELHVHLEGTAPPALIEVLARRNGMPLPEGVIAEDGGYRWRDFLDFLDTYDAAASVVRTAADYRDVTAAYLEACAAEGAIYVELTASPDHAAATGLAYADMVDGIAEGAAAAKAGTGIEAGVVVTAVRQLGPERALAVAGAAAAHPHELVRGFGLAGDEAGFPPGPFAAAFRAAHDAGLGITVHAGEWAGPESVRAALALPVPVARLGHGVRAIEDPALVEELAALGTVLEVCPTSNLVLGLYPSPAEHPFPRLRDAGVRVTLGSDDPPYWRASIGGEYALARSAWGLGDADLLGVTRTALEAAFAPPALRTRLLGDLRRGAARDSG